MVNVIRIAARYNNLALIEDRYGISLRKLVDYSRKYYKSVAAFQPILDEGQVQEKEAETLNLVQQATAILQFKLEQALIERRPAFHLNHRQVLTFIDYQAKTIELEGSRYPLQDFNAACINTQNPSQLTVEEEKLLQQLMQAFQNSERLNRQIAFLFEKGSMYRCENHRLLFHDCIPLHQNGDLKSLKIEGVSYSGRALLEFFESQLRPAIVSPQYMRIWQQICFGICGWGKVPLYLVKMP